MRPMRLGLLLIAALAIAACSKPHADAAPVRGHDSVARFADGFPKPDRPVAGIVAPEWSSGPDRDAADESGQLIRGLDIRPGMTVADIGAGSGYFTIPMSRLVRPGGRVYAVDIQRRMLEIIAKKIEKQKKDPVENVTLVLSEGNDPKLPADSIDVALMVDVYHELHEPQAVLKAIHTALKPGGRLILLEYRAEDPRVPIQPLHKMSIATAKQELEHEGFTLSQVKNDLPWQHLLVFTKP